MAPKVVHANLTNKSALVVDDVKFMRTILRQALKTLDFEDIYTVSGGRKALALLETKEVDVIFLDWDMEDMNGFEVLAAIRASNNKIISRLPVVVITGNLDVDNVASAGELGIDGYLKKPISPAVLLRCLDKIFLKK